MSRPARITTGRHPFEVISLLAVLAVGVALTLDGARPSSVRQIMPGWVQVIWLPLLILSGAAGLVGVWWPGRLDVSLAIESAAMVVLGSATSMYGLALFAYNGAAAIASGVLVLAYAAGAWWRLAQISHERKRATQITRQQ